MTIEAGQRLDAPDGDLDEFVMGIMGAEFVPSTCRLDSGT